MVHIWYVREGAAITKRPMRVRRSYPRKGNMLELKTGYYRVCACNLRQVVGELCSFAPAHGGFVSTTAETREAGNTNRGQATISRKLRDTLNSVLSGNPHGVCIRLRAAPVQPAVPYAGLVDHGRRKNVGFAHNRVDCRLCLIALINAAAICNTRERPFICTAKSRIRGTLGN